MSASGRSSPGPPGQPRRDAKVDTVAPAASSTIRSRPSASASSSMATTRTPVRSSSGPSGALDVVRGCSRARLGRLRMHDHQRQPDAERRSAFSPALAASTDPPCISTSGGRSPGPARGRRSSASCTHRPAGSARTRRAGSRADADARVADHDFDVRVDALEPDLDAAAAAVNLTAFDSRFQTHLLQAIGIARDRPHARDRGSSGAHALGVGGRLHRRDRVVDDQRQLAPAGRPGESCPRRCATRPARRRRSGSASRRCARASRGRALGLSPVSSPPRSRRE